MSAAAHGGNERQGDNRAPDLRAYYDEAAQSYAGAIEPLYGPLAVTLAAFAAIAPHEWVLDLGTGSGTAGQAALLTSPHVLGVDLSWRMADLARRSAGIAATQGDMHRLPLPPDRFDVALAAFSFNSTDPQVSFYEAWRVLKPSGRLAMQEWGTTDALSDLFYETVAAYAVEDPPPALALRRAAQSCRHPWDALETSDDLVAALEDASYAHIEREIATDRVRLPDVETFMRGKFAWPVHRAEFAAMSYEVQQLCLSDLRENLGAYTEPDGSLIWQPNVVRLRAHRPR